MVSFFRERFEPPKYLLPPLAGIELSTSSVKAVLLTQGARGLVLESYTSERLPAGAYVEGEIIDHATVAKVLSMTAKAAGISAANVSLPESKSYLFETVVSGKNKGQWYAAVEEHIDEFVPLPPSETTFDIVKTAQVQQGSTLVTGIGLPRHIVDNTLSAFDEAHIKVRSLEGELFACTRALLSLQDKSTILIIDIGRTTTKLAVFVRGIPRFTTTLSISGHALTLAVQKHFSVTEAEARKIKVDRGITSGNEEYLSAMSLTLSAIRDEIASCLADWQEKGMSTEMYEPVTQAILVGGNASVRGLPEYLEDALKIPVTVGDVFTNFASRDTWIPTLDFTESLTYVTAIGLALRDAT
jgi:type IV pilus assembly protein PilM